MTRARLYQKGWKILDFIKLNFLKHFENFKISYDPNTVNYTVLIHLDFFLMVLKITIYTRVGREKRKRKKNTAQKAGNLFIILYYLTF